MPIIILPMLTLLLITALTSGSWALLTKLNIVYSRFYKKGVGQKSPDASTHINLIVHIGTESYVSLVLLDVTRYRQSQGG